MISDSSTKQSNLANQKACNHPKILFGLMSSLALLIIVFAPDRSLAESPCGDIIRTYDGVDERDPIVDCSDPFDLKGAPDNQSFPYTLNDEVLVNDEVKEVESLPTLLKLAATEMPIGPNFNSFTLYQHEGVDYRLVDEAYTDRPTDVTLQISATGTYTIVTSFDSIFVTALTKPSWQQKLLTWLMPTAQAFLEQAPSESIRSALTFTVVEEPPLPTGASSVLFLPGIQASRLYKDGVLGTEDQLWEPNINNDVEQLEMNDTGLSVNDIYTRDVIDEIAFPILGGNIYKGFLSKLDDLKEEGVIADSSAFAYDWRYGVQDIARNGTKYEDKTKSLVDEVEDLADNSFTGKVTIIGHSNGGLLAKALITELERLGKVGLVDKVVFVGVPQLGSAKAIGVLLHGLDQQKMLGFVIDDSTVRDVIKNMPGVYGLLPSQRYFDLSDSPLVTSVGQLDTNGISEYGDIDSLDKLSDFVLDTQGLRNDSVPIYTPSTLNIKLMTDMVDGRSYFDDWLAPEGIKVYEVVGTGIVTIKGFEYRNFPCDSINAVCLFGSYAKSYPLFTNEGDETVTAFSADSYDGDKVTGVVDLIDEASNLFDLPENHSTLTESPTVQEFIDSIIRYPYLTDGLVVPQDFIEVARKYTIISTHSPVQISLKDVNGKRVGVYGDKILEEISGSQYFELGGSSYLIVPFDSEYEVTIKGTDTGVYSLVIDSLDEENIQSNLHTYLGASTSPHMEATFKASSTGFSNIFTDLDGDGDIDLENTLDGENVIAPKDYSYSSLGSEIESLELPRIYKKLLLIQVRIAERWSKKGKDRLELITLRNIEGTLKFYKVKKLITEDQFLILKDIINHLIN